MVEYFNRVLDVFQENINIPIGSVGTFHCPIGFSLAFESNLPKVKEDIDVYFYGSIGKRRQILINKLHNNNINLICDKALYGLNRDQKIMRSKIIINMKSADIGAYAPLHCLPVQCNKKLMMCEESNGDYGPYIPGKHFIEFQDENDAKVKIN